MKHSFTVCLPELNSGNSFQKVRKNRYQIFLSMPGFNAFLYFVRNIFPRLESFFFLPFKSRELTIYPFLIKVQLNPKMPHSRCSINQKIPTLLNVVQKRRENWDYQYKMILKRFLVYLENQTKETLIFTWKTL